MLWKKVWPKVNLPEVVTHLATRYLYRGQGVHLTKGQPAQSSTKLGHEMSTQGQDVWGWGGGYLTEGHPAQRSTKLGHEMSLLGDGGIVDRRGWGKGVHLTKGQPAQSSTKLGHKMSTGSGWYIWSMVSLPIVVPNLATRCLFWEAGVGVLGGRGIRGCGVGVHLIKGQPALM